MIGMNQFRTGMEIPAIAPVDSGNKIDMSDDSRTLAAKGIGPSSYVQRLIDKQKNGFPLDPHEQEIVSQYENGYIDINGKRTGKNMPAGGFQF